MKFPNEALRPASDAEFAKDGIALRVNHENDDRLVWILVVAVYIGVLLMVAVAAVVVGG